MDIIISNKKFPASPHLAHIEHAPSGGGVAAVPSPTAGAGAGSQTLHRLDVLSDHITSPLHRAVTLPLPSPLLWPGWEHCTCTLYYLD